MSESAHAWLLSFGYQQQIAVSEAEMVEYVLWPELAEVSDAPTYCSYKMQWRGSKIPVFDFSALLGQAHRAAIQHIGVVAYQTRPLTPLKYLALILEKEPKRISVLNEQFCDAPASYSGQLRPLLVSCFFHIDVATPVIDINYLASTELRQYLESSL